ncbi:gibberellin-regulated protein 9-like [Chenopodium quinoa]|uniref:gibberellin-regulated protein 9-like n=1 Tax=Chenopodium quinoa TaxID=63459 RepID=UPI000B7965C9|nr:gibberellin-regulated protein 9-like [Chenopodium quinoa]
MKLLGFLIFSVFILQNFSEALSATNNTGNSLTQDKINAGFQKKYFVRNMNCNHACAMRCTRSSRKNLCNRACNSCCFQCKCVPPGTYGNHHLCPCYARLRTHGNRPKCP